MKTYRLQVMVVEHKLGRGEVRLTLDGELVGPIGNL